MKLKALKPRLFNVMFHTHTVSGIVISFALFVIFYAGAFSLFRDELYRWENPLTRFETQKEIDFEAIIKLAENKLDDKKALSNITIRPPSKENPFVQFYSSYKTIEGKRKNISYYINPYTKDIYKDARQFNNPKSLTYMSDTIYRLHYFRQIPNIGIYLSGLTGFFMFFAIITGVLIHWKHIANKFYNFSAKGKWKQIWTNSHTVIGTITLPFQVIYAITGALIGLSLLLLAPSAFLLFDGDTKEIIKIVSPNSVRKYDDNAKEIESTVSIANLYNSILKEFPNHHITSVRIANKGKEDGTIVFTIDDKKGLSGNGSFLYSYKDANLIRANKPDKKSYTKGIYPLLIKLHYANFGGYLLKVIYFILAMITCYVITSGVMIWQTARNNAKYTAKQKRFHHKVTKVYLAITLSLFPAVVLIFIANKVFPIDMEFRVVYVKYVFFIGWLLLSLIGLFWNNFKKLNKNYLIMGSILAFCIPVLNGIVTKDWIWKTFSNHQYYVFSVDFAWLLTSICGVLIYYNLPSVKNE